MTRLIPSAIEKAVKALATKRPRRDLKATVRTVKRAPRRSRSILPVPGVVDLRDVDDLITGAEHNLVV